MAFGILISRRTPAIFRPLEGNARYEEQEIGNDPNEWFHRVHPDDIQALKNAVGAHINGKTPHLEAEYRIRHKDGTYRWMLCRA